MRRLSSVFCGSAKVLRSDRLLSDERVPLNAAGQMGLRLNTPWRDGTTHVVTSPLEFMQRLAAFVPRPSLPLISLVSA